MYITKIVFEKILVIYYTFGWRNEKPSFEDHFKNMEQWKAISEYAYQTKSDFVKAIFSVL